MVFVHAAGSWGVHYNLELEVLKRVKTALANSCLCRDLLSTRNLIESRLVPATYVIEDVVIGALNKKRPRRNAAKWDYNKDAPPGKRVNIAEQVSPLKILPLPPPKTDEANGTISGADPAATPPPGGLKHR